MPAFPTSSHRASAGPRWLSDTAIRRDVRAKPVSLPDLATRPGWAFGVYVHVPFCATRRGYSDFNTYTPAELGAANPDGWLAAVRAELGLAAVAGRAADRGHRVRRRRHAPPAATGNESAG